MNNQSCILGKKNPIIRKLSLDSTNLQILLFWLKNFWVQLENQSLVKFNPQKETWELYM